MKLSIMFGWVKNSDNFDFFMITKVSSIYLFRKCEGSPKASKARVSTFSMTRFVTTDQCRGKGK